jgi:hypothetical protein
MVGILRDVNIPQLRNIRKVAATALPLVILATPSLWLMLAVPPLWRDVDAYNQTVLPPGMVTILLHGPLYCTLNRVPLWFGYLVSGAGPAVSLGHFIKHSQLTDAGVFALLFLQHAALWFAAIYLIWAIAATLLTRVFLAILFASHPLFYTFAHCVGSESLSMILTLLLAGSGLRIMLRYPEIAARDWVIFTALFSCCVLTRHINCLLAAVLPITILALMLERGLHAVALNGKTSPALNSSLSKATRVWFVSIATGLIGLLCATSLTHLLCWRTHTPWRSTFGYTFLWRLNFLETMQAAPRQSLLNTVASKCELPESRQLLDVLRIWIDQNRHWDPPAFIREARSHLSSSEMKFHSEKFDQVLNDIAHGFLYPPAAPLRSIALADFAKVMGSHEGDVVRSLFVTTDYFFFHRDKMPQCSRLKTFRLPRERLIQARELSYFQWWNLLSLRALGILSLVVLLGAVVEDYKRGGRNAPAILFAACLCIVGMVMGFLNCFLAELQPRFILPMMELLLVSIMILLGVILSGFKFLDDEIRGP